MSSSRCHRRAGSRSLVVLPPFAIIFTLPSHHHHHHHHHHRASCSYYGTTSAASASSAASAATHRDDTYDARPGVYGLEGLHAPDISSDSRQGDSQVEDIVWSLVRGGSAQSAASASG